MGELDKVSLMLGNLQADMSSVKDTTDAIHHTIRETNDKVIVQEQKINAAHTRIDGLKPMQDTVAEHEAIKHKGIGIFMVLSTVCGGIGAFAMKVLF